MITPGKISTPKKASKILALLLFVGMSFSASGSILDSTVFRIKVLQDTVYAGDTVDVDIFIGGDGSLGILNILNEFEIEVSTDSALIVQDQVKFTIDSASLSTFFGTVFSSLSIIQNIDITQGILNVKGSSGNLGNGNARIGRGQYIVQDNAAGRQYMRYDFNKAISKGLLGILNPVRVIEDSVYIAEREVPVATMLHQKKSYKVFPNPTTNEIQVEGALIKQYKLLDANGKTIRSGTVQNAGPLQLLVEELDAGIYYLLVQDEKYWTSFKIVKN